MQTSIENFYQFLCGNKTPEDTKTRKTYLFVSFVLSIILFFIFSLIFYCNNSATSNSSDNLISNNFLSFIFNYENHLTKTLIGVVVSLPIFYVLWRFRTYDTREQIQKSEDNKNATIYGKGLELLFNNDVTSRVSGLLIMNYLRQQEIFMDEIDNQTCYTNLEHAKFLRANLSSINLSDANLSNAKLIEINLTGVNLSHADLRSAILINTKLINVQLLELESNNPMDRFSIHATLDDVSMENVEMDENTYNQFNRILKKKDLKIKGEISNKSENNIYKITGKIKLREEKPC